MPLWLLFFQECPPTRGIQTKVQVIPQHLETCLPEDDAVVVEETMVEGRKSFDKTLKEAKPI